MKYTKRIFIGSCGLLFWLCTSCSTVKKISNENQGAGEKASLGSASTSSSSSSSDNEQVTEFRVTDPTPPEFKVPEFDQVPEVVNPAVEKWMQYFQGKGRDHMERYLARSTRYESIMKKILHQNGLPEDLIYIALIESGFSPRAISRSAAVGYWQFIRGTGKRYGLQINTFIDERRDPVVATQAAAEYFKELYTEFNSWFLSMASYNVGEGRVRKEIRRNKTTDFWVIAKKRRLPKETVNYIPKFLAARMIAKNPEKYGFKDIPYEPPIEFETITLTQPVDMRQMAEKMNVDYAELKRLNPKYRGEVAPLENNKIVLRVPLGSTEIAMKSGLESTVKELVFIPDRGETDVYKVRPGDTLHRIARRFKTSVGLLRDLNDFKRRTSIKPGRTIFVPLKVSESLQYERAQMQSRASGGKQGEGEKLPSDLALYLVQEGDSLPEIAIKNNMTMAELMDLNNLTEGYSLKNGMQIKVRKITPEQGEPNGDWLTSQAQAQAKANESQEQAQAQAPVPSPTQAQNQEPLSKSEQGQTQAQAPELVQNAQTNDTVKPNQESLSSKDENSPTQSLKRHMVKSGENLFRIAKKYGVTISAIKKANNMKKRRSQIKAGTVLIIPTDDGDIDSNKNSEKDTEKARSENRDKSFNLILPVEQIRFS